MNRWLSWDTWTALRGSFLMGDSNDLAGSEEVFRERRHQSTPIESASHLQDLIGVMAVCCKGQQLHYCSLWGLSTPPPRPSLASHWAESDHPRPCIITPALSSLESSLRLRHSSGLVLWCRAKWCAVHLQYNGSGFNYYFKQETVNFVWCCSLKLSLVSSLL